MYYIPYLYFTVYIVVVAIFTSILLKCFFYSVQYLLTIVVFLTVYTVSSPGLIWWWCCQRMRWAGSPGWGSRSAPPGSNQKGTLRPLNILSLDLLFGLSLKLSKRFGVLMFCPCFFVQVTILKLVWCSRRADAPRCAHFPTYICSVIQEG